MGNTAFLVLENGKIFQGEYFGVEGEVTAEVVFSTSMTGYLKDLTTQNYYGQMVVKTFPLIGNYGVIPADFESDVIGPRAYIVKDWCQSPSNFRSEGDLDTFFKEKGVIGIQGIDTRTLTKTLREVGVMNGIITKNPRTVDFEKLKEYKIEGAMEASSTRDHYIIENQSAKYKVALLDYGMRRTLCRQLEECGAEIVVCPYDTTAQKIAEMQVDGIVLSNGPGNPADCILAIANVKEMVQLGIPIFAVGIGHQLLALANGMQIDKLKHGHRGANQPVKNLETGKLYITTQNHGYVVAIDSIEVKTAQSLFVNVNDGSCEGLQYENISAFSVQFYPEACGNSMETGSLFKRFFDELEARSQ